MLPTEQQIRAILSGPVKKSGSHLICTCWSCGREGKYYYNIKNGFSDCKICGIGVSLYRFLEGWDALHLLEGEPVNIELVTLLEQAPFVEYARPLVTQRLPVGFKKCTWNDDTPQTAYLKTRKYTEEDFLLYAPGYTTLVERLENYVIIPVYQNWQIKGYIARNILDDDRLRWSNQKGVPFASLLDGADECGTQTKNLIVVEGHFDKISVTNELQLRNNESFKCVASYGKKLTTQQIQLLEGTNVENLYLLYDPADAVQAIKVFGNRLKRRFNVLGCYANTAKDPGKMTGQQLLTILQKAEPIENYTRNYVQLKQLR